MLRVQVHFIVASCENMVDAKGLRPGDILTASNGKTVEVRRLLCQTALSAYRHQ